MHRSKYNINGDVSFDVSSYIYWLKIIQTYVVKNIRRYNNFKYNINEILPKKFIAIS